MMLEPTHPLAELLERDDRYHRDSYLFVFDALRFAQEKLNMGRVVSRSSRAEEIAEEEADSDFDEFLDDFEDELEDEGPFGATPQRHITGQDLCEAMRRYALRQYGLLAKSVLNHWGVRSTDDFGEIVFNLIDIGQMHKTDSDRREDFSDVYDFEQGLSIQNVFAEDTGSDADDAEPTA